MAASKNRSPSPNLARPNPNLRNSESNSSMRRSFSGNPMAKSSLFTNPRTFNPNPTIAANSPADSGSRKSLGKEEGWITGRRRSVGKEGGISEQRYEEEKENGSAKLEARFRSPARSTKNFMSPTISAACKFTPSPRKRVLAEKNLDSSIRASISFSSNDNIHKDPESDLKLLMGGVNQNKLAVNHVVLQDTCPPQVSSNSALKENACFEVHPSNSVLKNSLSDFQLHMGHVDDKKLAVNHVVLENECPPLHETSNSALKEKAFSNSVPIENSCVGLLSDELPLSSKTDDLSKTLSDLTTESVDCVDAAYTSLPPYDPTNNYLSPRPLFLRYNPNPRVEIFLNKQVLDFEDSSLKSEISSDTTDITSSEETQSQESSLKDDSSLVEMEQNTDPPLVSEPVHQDHFAPTKIVSKPPKFFTRTVSISLLLGFLIACLLCMSVTDIPVVVSPVFDPTFYHSYDQFEAVEFAKANFDGLFRNFKQWSSNSISFLSTLIPNFSRVLDPTSFYHSYDLFEAVEFAKANFDGLLRNFKQWSSNSISFLSTLIHNFSNAREELSLFTFSNTSSSHEDFLVVDNGFFNNDKLEENQEQNNGLENVREGEAETVIEEHGGEPGIEEMEQMTIQADLSDSGVSTEVDLERMMIIPSEVAVAAQQSEDEPLRGYEDLKRIEDQMGFDLQPVGVASAAIESEEFAKTDQFQGENDLSAPNELKPYFEEEVISEKSAEIVDQEVLVLDTQQLRHGESEENLSAGDVFLRHGVSVALPLAVILVLGSIFIIHMKMQSKARTNYVVQSSSFVVEKKIHEDEDDEVNDSLSTTHPLELSSSKRRGGVTEITSELSYSQDMSGSMKKSRNSKRESLASSDFSMGSPSYGSFTTYHHGSGDEIVTPIRRSSRIRSKVTN